MAVDFAPPQQERSRKTYERITRAAEQLLQTRSFEGTSVREIVRAAGCTEGPFYARFGSKEGFLRHLEERMAEEQRALIADVTGERWDRSDPVGSLRLLIREVVALYSSQRGVFRALVLRSRSDETLRARLDELGRDNLDRVVKVIRYSMDVERPDPEFAVRFAILMARATLREAVLFDELWPADASGQEERLVEEVSAAVVAYLEGGHR